jgi:predicted AAA+ superfamily ATPase
MITKPISARPRYLTKRIQEDLGQKMVFVGGPRQVGKTTLARALTRQTESDTETGYLNWDSLTDRDVLLDHRLPTEVDLLVLDEIHKFADWRSLVKGYYDKHGHAVSILVTGSGRLDAYRRGGDSLQGRYHYYRLHPFTLGELTDLHSAEALDALLRFGGFPEPFLQGSERFHRRWLREYSARVTHEDVRDLENVRDVTKLDLLLRHLPACVGSPLSLNQLRKLLQVSHESVERWLQIFERLYVSFRIPPFGSPAIRAVKKEQKLYFRDWSRVENPGARFENLVACHLLKYCDLLEDAEGFRMELRYLRDTDGREVDFVVLRDGSPEFAVECKRSERPLDKSIPYFMQRTGIPEFYQTHLGEKESGHAASGGRILPFHSLCALKNLP